MEKLFDDGCSYYTMEELEPLMANLMPGEFDPKIIKNTVLDVNYGSLPEQLLDVYYPDDKSRGGGRIRSYSLFTAAAGLSATGAQAQFAA